MSQTEHEDTIFDRILKGELPADIVFEDEDVLAFRDINPQAPIHVLVIPKVKWQGYASLQNEKNLEALGVYMKKIALVASNLGLDHNGYRVVFNQGQDGQQTVQYIHAHILGGRPMNWPPG
jgi:histidine triad (HIT) family protein